MHHFGAHMVLEPPALPDEVQVNSDDYVFEGQMKVPLRSERKRLPLTMLNNRMTRAMAM